jgi:hypothetical protein
VKTVHDIPFESMTRRGGGEQNALAASWLA